MAQFLGYRYCVVPPPCNNEKRLIAAQFMVRVNSAVADVLDIGN